MATISAKYEGDRSTSECGYMQENFIFGANGDRLCPGRSGGASNRFSERIITLSHYL